MISRIIKPAFLGAAATLLNAVAFAAPTKPSVQCNGTFTLISASNFVSKMNPGWNLGNTLDAVETEGSWNNPPVVPSTFDDIKASGYKGIRLPVTWAYHFTSTSPSWNVDPVWLQRVSDVLDMITSRGLYTIVNVHHDSWIWADITKPDANITMIEERFYRLWYQIGTKLACKSSLVAFEPINEEPGETEAHGTQINKLNNIFLQAINDAGGFNPQRVVTLVGAGEDGAKTSLWFKAPEAKFKNPYAIQYHYYSPYDFIFSAWGKTIWGSTADKIALETDLSLVRSNFTNTPLIIGEWAASMVATENAARWKYVDFFIRTAAKYNTATVVWDNGADSFDRAKHAWRDEVTQDILTNASQGVPNTLPESTEDGNAERQESAAYVYQRVGEEIKDVKLGFKLNGNVLEYAKLADKKVNLSPEREYGFSASGDGQEGSVTFKAGFLKTLLGSNGAVGGARTGSIANISLTFNAGADLLVDVLVWDTPILGASTSKLVTGKDLLVPVTWKGQNRPAAIKAVKKDGGYLVDDWTQWLGPLQKGRLTYNNHWNWDAKNVILTSGLMDSIKSAGQDVTLTIDFYPRVAGNSVNYTITV